MVFRGMMRGICGLCCAAVMVCCGRSEVSGMERNDLISEREAKKIVLKLKQITPLAIDNLEKLEELVKYLLERKHSGPCNVAIGILADEARNKGIESSEDFTHKRDLLIDMINFDSYGHHKEPSFFIDRYKTGFYANFHPQYGDY